MLASVADADLPPRGESDTDPEDARLQESTGEIWGRPQRWGGDISDIPKVKAYSGPLPDGERGIEFATDVPPDAGCPPEQPSWSGPRPGVTINAGFATLKVTVLKNTQK